MTGRPNHRFDAEGLPGGNTLLRLPGRTIPLLPSSLEATTVVSTRVIPRTTSTAIRPEKGLGKGTSATWNTTQSPATHNLCNFKISPEILDLCYLVVRLVSYQPLLPGTQPRVPQPLLPGTFLKIPQVRCIFFEPLPFDNFYNLKLPLRFHELVVKFSGPPPRWKSWNPQPLLL